MKVISVRNVHQALPEACHQLRTFGVRRPSRNGDVVAIEGPLCVHLHRPTERVLFWERRAANPFFHLFEALWMLGGKNDVAYLAQFNARMAEFSDDGLTFNAAYGHRWRRHFGVDQVQRVASALALNAACRRQVISMWDPSRDLGLASRDIPCNLQVVVQVGADGRLHCMTTNRSNDVVWGMLGANAVHLSALQELLAALIGVPVGESWQVSMNAHIYLERHGSLMADMADQAPMPPAKRTCPYSAGEVETFPLVGLPAGRWFRELDRFLLVGAEGSYDDPFLSNVAAPLMRAWAEHKRKRPEHAMTEAAQCLAPDWQRAALEWLQRRAA